MIDSSLLAVAREFSLGAVADSSPLAGGGADVVALRTSLGAFVVKRPWNVSDVELYAVVERRLNAGGIRQARQLAAPGGSHVSTSGHAVQELLPGRIAVPPTPAQTGNFLCHLRTFDEALASVAVPPWLAERDTIWTRVTRIDYLLGTLPSLLESPRQLAPVFAMLESASGSLEAQPKQLVHGDLGPDNVLVEGDEVVAIIDFTPFHDTVLLGLASAVYFFQLLDATPDRDAIEESWATYGVDPALGWPALCRESLRRLATPLATGGSQASLAHRYRAALQLAGLLAR